MVEKTHQAPKRKTFGETVGGRAFPDAAEAKVADIIGKQLVVYDVAFKEMQFGEVAILLFEYPDNAGAKFSVLVGGEVVRKKVREAKEKNLLPLFGTIVHDAVYYDIA